MATLEAIQAKMKRLQAQAEALIAEKAQAALDQIRALMIEHGLTTADIEAKAKLRRERARATLGSATSKGKSAPKYQDPKTGATWTGHGRAPAWIASARDRTKFLIAGATIVGGMGVADKSKAATKSAGKGTAKGKLAPKYLNPKTGETWSGHARPPAWIKNAKDRSKFLIAGGADGVVANSGTASKKATAKKTVATKSQASAAATAPRAPMKKAAAAKKTAGSKTVGAKKASTPAAKRGAVKKAVGRKVAAAEQVTSNADVNVPTEATAAPTSA